MVKKNLMWCRTSEGHETIKVRLNGVDLEEMNETKYQGSAVSGGGEMEVDLTEILSKGTKMM